MVAALAFAGVAEAKRIAFGSNLKAPATRSEAHPVDSVFWAKKLQSHGRVRVPRRGRIATIKIKGTAVRHTSQPNTLISFKVLHPRKHGRVHVRLTSNSYHLPVGGDPNRVTTYHPVNLCARKGDYVAFADVGGYQRSHYPHGTPFQIFSSVSGSTTNFYSKRNGTNNGATFKGHRHRGEELLMRMVVVTGAAAGVCR